MNQKNWRTILCIFILLLSGVLGFVVSWYHHKSLIAPTAQGMQTFHYPTLFVNQLLGDKNAGEKIYTEYCSSCHSPNPVIDINAPATGNEKAWHFRRQLGIDALLKTTINGKGAMPARGGCFECSDDQLRAAIQYMLHPAR